MQRIFVNIASLLDSELVPTITSALSKSQNPSALHFSVVHQHVSPIKDELDQLVSSYGATLDYKFINLENVKGVGYARALANETLDHSYSYYLQIDSHTRFDNSWDLLLINSYNADMASANSNFIYSALPKYYGYVDDDNWYSDHHLQPPTKIEDDKIFLLQYYPKHSYTIHKIYMDNDSGKLYDFYEIPWSDKFDDRTTQYFTANFVFGEAKHFISIKYDPGYAYTGEELSMSVRFFAKNIKIVVPRVTPIWTDYGGHEVNRRSNFFIDQGDYLQEEKSKIPWDAMQQSGIARLGDFRRGLIDGEFGVTEEQFDAFVKKHVRIVDVTI